MKIEPVMVRARPISKIEPEPVMVPGKGTVIRLRIDLRGLAANEPDAVQDARKQLDAFFGGNLEDMRIYYGWKVNAPVLKIIKE